VPLGASELGDLLFVLQQLRLAVSSLADQGQWLAASAERPISRAKVGRGRRTVINAPIHQSVNSINPSIQANIEYS
jgi:hypothetical protein